MKGNAFALIFGVLVWFVATMFFVILGERVLYPPGTVSFAISITLLVVGTGFLLWGITYIYLLFDKTENAPLKFGIIGTMIGLALDTFSLSFHQFIFPNLAEPQVIAFTAWMSFAYALYLFIPAFINKKRSKSKREYKVRRDQIFLK
ncbi:DUF5367 family protein [Peribacillus asahii]|uniref:DUF5367 family protein n=1 Tax=Peribacillus asahii TaxID=228899 RepID=UPI002079AEE2|nr:DUF5367 family protein [Peribacillus asahii]USK68892.1 DUF5367 domain-containing protein [Peribacillus asahii]